VLNEVTSGHKILSELAAAYGRVIEIAGQKTTVSASSLYHQSIQTKKNIMFANINPLEMLQDRARMKTALSAVGDLIMSSKVKLLANTPQYTFSQFQEWLRSQDNLPSLDKILVSYNSGEQGPSTIKTAPTLFHADATYIIIGGLGGLGKSIVKWMISHGARNLLLLSRHGMPQREQSHSSSK
jgi:hypothetical protein